MKEKEITSKEVSDIRDKIKKAMPLRRAALVCLGCNQEIDTKSQTLQEIKERVEKEIDKIIELEEENHQWAIKKGSQPLEGIFLEVGLRFKLFKEEFLQIINDMERGE